MGQPHRPDQQPHEGGDVIHIGAGHERGERGQCKEQSRAEHQTGPEPHEPKEIAEEEDGRRPADRAHQPGDAGQLAQRQHGRPAEGELGVDLPAGIDHQQAGGELRVRRAPRPEPSAGEDLGLQHLNDFVDHQRPAAEDESSNQSVADQCQRGDGAEAADTRPPADRRVEQTVAPDESAPPRYDREHDRDAGNDGRAADPPARDITEPADAPATGNPVDDREKTEDCQQEGGGERQWVRAESLHSAGAAALARRRGGNRLKRRI